MYLIYFMRSIHTKYASHSFFNEKILIAVMFIGLVASAWTGQARANVAPAWQYNDDRATEVVEQFKLLASDGVEDDFFGSSVVINNGLLAVSAVQNGSVYLFKKNSAGDYEQKQKLINSDGVRGGRFGNSIAMDNGVVVVGANLDNDSKGSVYVFTPNAAGNYEQTQKLTAIDGMTSDYFGHSVAIDNGVIAVGAYGNDDKGSDSGSVYLFTKNAANEYEQIQNLTANDADVHDRFGDSVAFEDGLIAVGAFLDDDKGYQSGSVYLFTKDAAGEYEQIQKLSANDGVLHAFFGISVAIDNGLVVVGARNDIYKNNRSGSAYLFTLNTDGNYEQKQKLNANDFTALDFFGVSVAIDNGVVVVGANGDDIKGGGSGSIYLFTSNSAGNYEQTQKLTSDDGVASGQFGASVAIDNGVVAVGAIRNNDNEIGSGSAYLYELRSQFSIKNAEIVLAENSNSVDYGLIAKDADGDELTYTLAGVDKSVFNINFTGGLSFNQLADYENPYDDGSDNTYNVTLLVSDATLENELALQITVTDSPDTDLDGIDNNVDTDDDNDGLLDSYEIEIGTDPLLSDSDEDGINDNIDAFPLDSGESVDTDLDGIGNNADTDDDNDGLPDTYELANSLDPLDFADAAIDNDGDSLSNFAEFRIGTNINLADTDGDGINDNIDNNPLVFDEPTPTLYSGQLTVLPDTTDDGIKEVGILKVNTEKGQVNLDILNGQDLSLIKTIIWFDSFVDTTLALHVIPDMNDNGVDEIGLFGVQETPNNEGKPQMFVRDLLTGNRVSVFNWPANWKGVSALVLNDMSGDGIAEIGVQGRFKDGNRPQLVVRNGANGSSQGTYGYPNIFASPIFYQHSDVDGDGFEEIATFGRITRNNKIQIKIASGIGAQGKLKAYNFPDKWSNVSWHRLDDSNVDGIDDWGLFGISRADGRPQLVNKDGSNPKGALRIYAWPADMKNAKFFRIPDMNYDGVDEVAAAGRRSNGRYQFIVKDGLNRNSILANHNLNLNLESVINYVLPDLSGDEKAEIGFIGINPQGEYELVIQYGDKVKGEYARHNLGGDWENAPAIASLGDTNEDGLADLLVYGQNAAADQLVIMSL